MNAKETFVAEQKPLAATPRGDIMNAQLVALSLLLSSSASWAPAILPHLVSSDDTPDFCSAGYGADGQKTMQYVPERNLLDTLASLCAFHPDCDSAVVALEHTPDYVGLYFATGDPAGPSPRLVQDVQAWIEHTKDTANALQLKRDPQVHETEVVVAVYRACYGKLRAHVRKEGTLEKLLGQLRDTGHQLSEMRANLLLVTRYTGCEGGSGPEDDLRLTWTCIAGWRAVDQLRDAGVRETLERINIDACQIIEDACALSTLVHSLILAAGSFNMSSALARPWTIRWLAPPVRTRARSDSETVLDPVLIQHWLNDLMRWRSPVLSGPPDLTSFPWSEVVAPLLHGCPPGLVRIGSHLCFDPTHDSQFTPSAHCGGLGTLLRYLAENPTAAYPYVATSTAPCYACMMLARAVSAVRGPGGETFLRGCDTAGDGTVVLTLPWRFPWGRNSKRHAHGRIEREMERALGEDLQMLLLKGAELAVAARATGSVRELRTEFWSADDSLVHAHEDEWGFSSFFDD